MHASRLFLTAAAVVLLVSLSGCAEEQDRGSPTPGTTFYGTYADQAGNAGTVELNGPEQLVSFGTVLGQDDGTALDGEMRVGGGTPIPLVGLYDAASGTIAFASDDGRFNFNGRVAEGQGSGFGFGPGGPATFVVFLGGTPHTVDVYCGTATCTSPPGCVVDGGFNIVIAGAQALTAVHVDGEVAVGAGTMTGADVSVVTQDQVGVTVHGDISGTIVTGTWRDEAAGTSGTWRGSSSQCQAAPA